MPSKRMTEGAGSSSKKKLRRPAPEEEPEVANASGAGGEGEARPRPVSRKAKKQAADVDEECSFTSEAVQEDEARQRWPHRYQKPKMRRGSGVMKDAKSNEDEEELIPAKRHFTQATVDGFIYDLYDDAYVKAGEGEDNYICKIVEMFEAEDGSFYFNAQWYYRAKDTVIGQCGDLIDEKRVFFSEVKNDNPLDCLVQKLKIVRLASNVSPDSKIKATADCDYYCDKMYLLPYTTFVNLIQNDMENSNETESTVSTEVDGSGGITTTAGEVSLREENEMEMTLLDVYSGCGAMSTGLCLGANRGDVKLVTKWAVDINEYACECLRLNHPETQVRNETAEAFLSLLKEWEKLCASFSLIDGNNISDQTMKEDQKGIVDDDAEEEEEEEEEADGQDGPEVYEVAEILNICYGDPSKSTKVGLHFKIRWKGYGPEWDTWEPLEGLSDCPDKLKDFVTKGYKSKLLPLPGNIDVICGGPPCQGISGFNRFRNYENPLADEKNKQLQVFMDLVSFLKPRFVLMENVVDLVKFADGFLGRYALARLVGLGYQSRIGLMAAGAYGLPQFRMRVFLWGALSTEKLPQYPLPTHNVVVRGVVPTLFESNVVAYEEGKKDKAELEKELFLGDAISDLPPVENNEQRDEMPYSNKPKTNFQHFIRLKKEAMYGCADDNLEPLNQVLYDHRPLKLNDDDYQRVTNIPRRKGANFRDLAGVRVNPISKKAELDPDMDRVYLPSGKPLVPDYAISFVNGTSLKPFGRLWWDETVPTVVTRAEPHNQALLHPLQDRVLTIRENARLQGFPDYYKLVGPIKERYIQVGNAVAVPVSRALGYCLALACKGVAGDESVMALPANFSKPVEVISPAESS